MDLKLFGKTNIGTLSILERAEATASPDFALLSSTLLKQQSIK
jgi:hypothetical protein